MDFGTNICKYQIGVCTVCATERSRSQHHMMKNTMEERIYPCPQDASQLTKHEC